MRSHDHALGTSERLCSIIIVFWLDVLLWGCSSAARPKTRGRPRSRCLVIHETRLTRQFTGHRHRPGGQSPCWDNCVSCVDSTRILSVARCRRRAFCSTWCAAAHCLSAQHMRGGIRGFCQVTCYRLSRKVWLLSTGRRLRGWLRCFATPRGER